MRGNYTIIKYIKYNYNQYITCINYLVNTYVKYTVKHVIVKLMNLIFRAFNSA